MPRWGDLLKHGEARAVALILGFLLLSWPVVTGSAHRWTGRLVLELFVAWAIVVALLFSISRPRKPDPARGPGESPDV